MRTQIPFNGPSQEDRIGIISGQQSINLRPKIQSAGDKNKISLYSTPGLKLYTTGPQSVCRSNGYAFKGNLYFVSGTALIYINSGAAVTTVGTLSTSTSRVEMAVGRDYIALVDGTNGYSYDGTTFAQISDADFPANPSHITYLDGYFIVNQNGSDQFNISSSEDPTAWDALDFATAEARPDDVIAHTSNQKDLYLGGQDTTQVYYNSSNPDFPFDPYPNGVMQVGVEAPHSMVSCAYGVIWLGRTKDGEIRVTKSQGLQPVRISSDDIDWKISQLNITSDAIAWVEQDGDQSLYVLTFPADQKTFCYDLTLEPDIGWFEKKSFGVGRWRANGYGVLSSTKVVGDYSNNKFYTLDFNTYDEDTATLERIRRTQIIHADKKLVTFYELLLDMQTGVGLVTGQGSDPQIMMRFSNDGGATWSNELWGSIGKLGERNIEVFWNKLGAARSWMFEVKVTDPVEVNILDAYADIEVARE